MNTHWYVPAGICPTGPIEPVLDNCPLYTALPFFTTNVAGGLGLSDKKGCVQMNADADMILLNDNLEIDTVIAKGKVLMRVICFLLVQWKARNYMQS